MAGLLSKIKEVVDNLFNVEDKLEGIIARAVSSTERMIMGRVKRIKRMIILSLWSFLLFGISALLLVGGIVFFFVRFFPPDLVLIVMGAVILYVALLIGLSNK